MEDKPVNIEVEIKKESQDEEIVSNGTNIPDLITSTDKNVKNEPLEEQAGCSSLQITNCFSIPNGSTNAAVVDNNSISSTPNDSNKPSTLPPNDVVKTEKEDASTEPSTGSQPGINSNPAEIKKEPDDIKPCLPLDAVVKEENTTNDVKQDPDPSSTIANILTSSIPSTSGTCSSTVNDQTDDVSSSTDGKPVCRYGKNCYRLNDLHRQNFYHPPGSDPLKSPEKPRCKYGNRCYRKNEEHRKRFIHDRSPDNTMSNKRKRKVKNATNQMTRHVYESDSDDSSLSDESYDGSSDEFHPDGDTDSDDTDFDVDLDQELLNND